MEINFTSDDVRVILHLLGVIVWLGGQVMMLGLLPVLRQAGGDVPKAAAIAFGRVAWPAFLLIIITGMWNVFALDMTNASTGWSMAFGFKFLLVIISGVAAWVHQRARTPSIKAMTGGLGFVTSLGALVLGALMAH